MFIYKTTKFAPVWTTIPKIRGTFVHQTLTEHVLCSENNLTYVELKLVQSPQFVHTSSYELTLLQAFGQFPLRGGLATFQIEYKSRENGLL